jgi:hypothetical protein
MDSIKLLQIYKEFRHGIGAGSIFDVVNLNACPLFSKSRKECEVGYLEKVPIKENTKICGFIMYLYMINLI